jgi:CDP-glycerol glycerophosphotransferase (TagB/SpsB family)
VVLYAPTGAHDNSLETFGEDLIKRMGAMTEYDFLVKPHDHPKASINWFERLATLETENVRLLRAADAMPGLHAADMLISDASSIANEYLLLDRPLVFLDVPELLAAAAGEEHLPPGLMQLFGQLAPGLAAAHDQHVSGRQRVGVPVVLGQHLVQRRGERVRTPRPVRLLITPEATTTLRAWIFPSPTVRTKPPSGSAVSCET